MPGAFLLVTWLEGRAATNCAPARNGTIRCFCFAFDSEDDYLSLLKQLLEFHLLIVIFLVLNSLNDFIQKKLTCKVDVGKRVSLSWSIIAYSTLFLCFLFRSSAHIFALVIAFIKSCCWTSTNLISLRSIRLVNIKSDFHRISFFGFWFDLGISHCLLFIFRGWISFLVFFITFTLRFLSEGWWGPIILLAGDIWARMTYFLIGFFVAEITFIWDEASTCGVSHGILFEMGRSLNRTRILLSNAIKLRLPLGHLLRP